MEKLISAYLDMVVFGSQRQLIREAHTGGFEHVTSAWLLDAMRRAGTTP